MGLFWTNILFSYALLCSTNRFHWNFGVCGVIECIVCHWFADRCQPVWWTGMMLTMRCIEFWAAVFGWKESCDWWHHLQVQSKNVICILLMRRWLRLFIYLGLWCNNQKDQHSLQSVYLIHYVPEIISNWMYVWSFHGIRVRNPYCMNPRQNIRYPGYSHNNDQFHTNTS